MKKNLLGLAVATTLSLAAMSASAEDMFRGAWYAVPGVTYLHADDDLQSKNNGYGGFLSIGKELSQSWDLQGRLGYNTAKEEALAATDGRYKQTTLGLDALYMFSRDQFRPFLLAGVGAARNNVDYTVPGVNLDNKKTSWLAGLGLGAQYLLSDSFGLQADVRHQWSKAKTDLTGSGDDDTIGNTLLNLGGVIRFGAPEPVAVAPAPEPAPIAVAPEPAPAPAPEPVVEAPKCEPTMDKISVAAEKLFDYDKAALQTGAKPILDDAAAKIKANPEIKSVIVTGHTDRIGSDKYNQKLSERRAKVVSDYLASQGVDSAIISAIGKGEAEPVVQCEGNKATKKLISCLAPNRRVDINAEGTKEVGCK